MNPHQRIDNPSCCLVTPRHRFVSVRRAGVEPAQPAAGGLQPLGLANAQPTHVVDTSGTGGSRTRRHQGLSLAAMPVRVPCRQSGSGGSRTHSIPGSKPRWSASCLPSRRRVSTQSRREASKHSATNAARRCPSRAALPVGVSGREWSRMESNHRFLDVSQASSPLDHGTVFVCSGPTGNCTRISSVRGWCLPVGR